MSVVLDGVRSPALSLAAAACALLADRRDGRALDRARQAVLSASRAVGVRPPRALSSPRDGRDPALALLDAAGRFADWVEKLDHLETGREEGLKGLFEACRIVDSWPWAAPAVAVEESREPLAVTLEGDVAACVRVLSGEKELSHHDVVVQALRLYQERSSRLAAGERPSWSGDAERTKLFSGPVLP